MKGGRIAQWIAFLLLTQQPRVRLSAYPGRIFSLEFFLGVDEFNQWDFALLIQWAGQKSLIVVVDRTHAVLASGELALQNKNSTMVGF